MNSDMVKPEKFGRLRLGYHFTVPLSILLTTATASTSVERTNSAYYM